MIAHQIGSGRPLFTLPGDSFFGAATQMLRRIDVAETVSHTPSIAVEVGDIVQANPEICEWGPALVVVSEVKPWGVQGFTSIPRGGEAYIRLKWAEIEATGGKAVWMPK